MRVFFFLVDGAKTLLGLLLISTGCIEEQSGHTWPTSFKKKALNVSFFPPFNENIMLKITIKREVDNVPHSALGPLDSPYYAALLNRKKKKEAVGGLTSKNNKS